MTDFKVFLICIALGLILGAVWGILNIVKAIFKKNIFSNNILDFLYVLFYSVALVSTLIKFNFGKLRLYLIIASLLGTIIERKTLGKLFAKIYLWLYNKWCKVYERISKTKFYKKITK